MSDNVHYLHGRPREIAQMMRVGFEHRLLEQLLSSGKLSARRFLLEAAYFERQPSLVRMLRDESAEIILDTNAAELSVPGKFGGSAKAAPWAAKGRPLERGDFIAGTNRSVVEPIARFVIANNIHVVMAPTHYLGEGQEHWFDGDRNACEQLRLVLDRFGGGQVAVDYPLIVSYSQLRDPAFRKRTIAGLKDIPFEYLWLRVSGFGADATGAGVERYIRGIFEFHELNRPIIADQVGGLTALAVTGFGAASGFAHGAEKKERFSTEGWLKSSGRGGGGEKTVYIPGLDRRLKVSELRKLFDEARTSRAILGCSDGSCCADTETMLRNPEGHYVLQRGRQVQALSRIPESLRSEQFLENYADDACARAQRALRLKRVSDELKAKIRTASTRLDRFRGALINLHEQLGLTDFAEEAVLRSEPMDLRGEGHRS